MGSMNVLGREGDWKLEWNPDSVLEVEQVRKTFDHNVKDKGFAAFKVNKKGQKTKQQIHEFDPKAERIILVPPIAGG